MAIDWIFRSWNAIFWIYVSNSDCELYDIGARMSNCTNLEHQHKGFENIDLMLWVQSLFEIFNMHKWLWEIMVKQNTKDNGKNKATMYGKRYPWKCSFKIWKD